MKAIQAFLETVKQGGKQSHLNMTIIPLLAPDVRKPSFLILEEALEKGVVEITEVNEGGRVQIPRASRNLLDSMKNFHIMKQLFL